MSLQWGETPLLHNEYLWFSFHIMDTFQLVMFYPKYGKIQCLFISLPMTLETCQWSGVAKWCNFLILIEKHFLNDHKSIFGIFTATAVSLWSIYSLIQINLLLKKLLLTDISDQFISLAIRFEVMLGFEIRLQLDLTTYCVFILGGETL